MRLAAPVDAAIEPHAGPEQADARIRMGPWPTTERIVRPLLRT